MRPDFSAFTRRFQAATEGLSLRQISQAIGISTSQVSHYRTGGQRPARKTLPRIAAAYGGTVDEWLQLAGYADIVVESTAGVMLIQAKAGPAGAYGDPAFRPRDYFADTIAYLDALFGRDLEVKPADFPSPRASQEEVAARLLEIGRRALDARDRRRGHKGGSRRPVQVRQAA